MKYVFIGCLVILMIGVPNSVIAQTTDTTSTTTQGFTIPVVKSWITQTHQNIEIFRLAQAEYFTTVRDELKKKLKIDVSSESQKSGEGIAGGIEEPSIPKSVAVDNPVDYIRYIFSISFTTLFSETLVFYGMSLLLTLIGVRFIVSRLV